MALNLYLLRREDSRHYWDQTVACVVAASSERDARQIAELAFKGENPEVYKIWRSPSTQVTELGVAAEHVTPDVVLSEFIRG